MFILCVTLWIIERESETGWQRLPLARQTYSAPDTQTYSGLPGIRTPEATLSLVSLPQGARTRTSSYSGLPGTLQATVSQWSLPQGARTPSRKSLPGARTPSHESLPQGACTPSHEHTV